ncbi:GTP-binding protein [Micromonospora sp. NPDC047620]|uniref:GTP-binding protein n=1 Tax=Micromonospora sp. NPDC047620 TaxID=3364251 RepID=UPI0037141A01
MITFIALSGFLGAGKTTTMVAAAHLLERQGKRVAVVTNDQGTDLVDTKVVRSSLDAVAQVTGGCFCCRFEDLVHVVEQLITDGDVDVVIAEAVGSCTDLQATVVRPLRKFYADQFVVAPLATVVDPLRWRAFARAAQRGEPESDLSYLFGRQLREADVLAINKIDLVGPAETETVVASLRAQNPDAVIVPYSAKSGTGLADLIEAWSGQARWSDDLDVDYDRYAAAEAQLAWLNQQVTVAATNGGFSPSRWATAVLTHLAATAADADVEIGHAKLTVDSGGRLTKMSVTGNGTTPSVDFAVDEPTTQAVATVNARVACEPTVLDEAVRQAIAHADALTGAISQAADTYSFKPGYPMPIHRISATMMEEGAQRVVP